MRDSQVHLPRKESAWSCHQHLFEKNVKKTETCGLRTLSVKGLGIFFTHWEGISTPHIRHKGWQPLIKCARHNFKIKYFSFFYDNFFLLTCLRNTIVVKLAFMAEIMAAIIAIEKAVEEHWNWLCDSK